MSVAFDSNVTLTVEIGFASNPTVSIASTTWTDVSADVRGFETGRGRQHELDRFEAGTFTVTLNNRDRDYDPTYTSSPHYPNVIPMRRVRIRATHNAVTYDVINGFIESIELEYPTQTVNKGDAIAVLRCVDGFKALALAQIASSTYYPNNLSVAARSHFRLGERPGSATVADSGTNPGGWVGNVHGTVTFGADGALRADRNTAADFGVRTGYIRVPGLATNSTAFITGSFWPSTDSLNIEFWIYVRSRAANDTVFTSLDSSGKGIKILVAAGTDPTTQYKLQWVSSSASTSLTLTTSNIAFNTWHHLDFHRNSVNGDHQIRIDGSTDIDGTATISWPAPTAVYFGGGDLNGADPAPRFDGILDEVATYGAQPNALTHFENGEVYRAAFTDDRIERILDIIGWPTAERVMPSQGQSIVRAEDRDTDFRDTAALTHLQDVETTEGGALYMQRDGKLKFRARHAILTTAVHTTSQATFGDAAGELKYRAISMPEDDDHIVNFVTVTPGEGAPQTAEDSTSQSKFYTRSLSVSTRLRDTDTGEALDAANWLLTHGKDPDLRIETIEITPRKDPTNLWPQALGRELEDRVTAKRRPPGTGTISKEVLIQHIGHTVDAATKTWVTRFQLSPAETQQYWVMGDTTLSVLGTSTRLAY